ncbi:hypothetical protein ACFQ1S_00485 [Kibdelosporangium lantanae]|uniref:DUF7192 domain-containing protein n=1 Tax=Kibdelosporangium lantanae TaxID=1497396 RepID=A0ABW3M0G3_9PSEU
MAVAENTLTTVERTHDTPIWQPRFEVDGSDVDVARYLSGEPENMISYSLVTTPTTGRVISLAVNLGATGGVSVGDMVKRGKSVVALVYALERMGLSTELFADSQSGSRDLRPETTREMVKVKGASDALDPAMIMFALAHPSFYRGLLFASMHAHPARFHEPLDIGRSYGNVLRDLPNDVFPDGCIVLNTAMRPSDLNVSDAEAFVVKHLKELGLI